MDPITASVWRAIGEAVVLLNRGAPNHEVRLTPTAAMALSGEPAADFNNIVIAGGSDPAAQLREFVQVAQARNLPLLAFVSEEVNEALAPTATDLGLQHAGSVPLMTFRPTDGRVAPSPFEITRVQNEEDLRYAVDLASRAFNWDVLSRVVTSATLDVPGIEAYIAWRDGVPISTVWPVRGGTTVGIWCMATPAEQQRQGAGRALLEQVLADHTERGATLFYLMATEAGFPLYQRIGFQTVANVNVWVAGHTTQLGH